MPQESHEPHADFARAGARADRSGFGSIVVTAANARQAAAYDRQLRARSERGSLLGAAQAFALADARDARIGSGAATVLALVEVAGRLARTKRAASLAELFAGERVLILHSGGDSRRLPMYAVEGKLFATLPMQGRGNRCATLFDLLLDDLGALAPRAGGEVLVAAGDAVLGIARNPVRFEGPGVIGIAQRADLARASRHGVFVRADGAGSDEVAGFLQKPDAAAMHAAGAVGRDGRALVDLGVFSFDPASVAALLEGCGVTLRAGRLSCAKDGLAALAARAALPPIDLYREVAMALPQRVARGAYLAGCGADAADSPLAPVLGALHDALHRSARDARPATPFRVQVADIGDFLHIGATRELLQALVGPGAHARAFGVACASFPETAALAARRASSRSASLLTLDSIVRGPVDMARGRAILDRCDLGRVRLGGDNVVVGVGGGAALDLPAGASLFRVPLGRGRAALVACGAGDDFKTPLRRGGTFLDAPFEAFCRRAGLAAEALCPGDGTLWDAPLWRIGHAAPADIAWMLEGRRAPRAWRDDRRRCSMRELLALASCDAIEAERADLARRAAMLAPARALAGAVDARDARATLELLEAAPRADRARVASRIVAALPALLEPETRGHVAALGARIATGSALHARLRAQAFAAVGDAVLSRFDLPARPLPAAIMHDQAVWTSTPVRVDLAGGWTDTPPICNAVGGSVVNVAVTLRGQLPIQVVAKLDELRRGEAPVIRITSTDLGETRVIRSTRDLARRGDPTRWSSLAENALVLTGAAPADPRASLASWLMKVGGGLSLTMFSAVPKGSGLGTSSILGAATIQCLDRVFGRERSPGALFAATSALEQMLSTRGGWQDQVGGVLGGFKIARTERGAAQVPAAERLAVSARLADELRARSVLYFTGQRRMAKNILENVVWNWLTHEPSARVAVDGLHANAERMRAALLAGDADGFAGEIAAYMRLKRQIDPGCCPQAFDDLAAGWRRELAAWSFAGAGGGGFMLLVAKDARRAESMRAAIERNRPNPRARAFDFDVDPAGLRCAVL